MNEDEVRQQLQQSLKLLRAAGVDFVSKVDVAALPKIQFTSQESREPEHAKPVVMPTLFGDVPTGLAVPESAEGRRIELQRVAEEVKSCSKCPELYSTRTNTVFGSGPVDAELVFIGEGPGGEEDRIGEPFVGPSGQLLDKMILAMGLKRADCYIMNVVKCRPPGNRQPEASECLNCRPFFDRQLEMLRPKVIVCLGGVAAQNLLQTKIGVMKLRGTWHKHGDIPVMPTYHPAALLRNPEWKRDAWEDLKAVLAKLGKPVPGK